MISVKWSHAHDRSRVQAIVERIKKRNREQRELEENKKKEKPSLG